MKVKDFIEKFNGSAELLITYKNSRNQYKTVAYEPRFDNMDVISFGVVDGDIVLYVGYTDSIKMDYDESVKYRGVRVVENKLRVPMYGACSVDGKEVYYADTLESVLDQIEGN